MGAGGTLTAGAVLAGGLGGEGGVGAGVGSGAGAGADGAVTCGAPPAGELGAGAGLELPAWLTGLEDTAIRTAADAAGRPRGQIGGAVHRSVDRVGDVIRRPGRVGAGSSVDCPARRRWPNREWTGGPAGEEVKGGVRMGEVGSTAGRAGTG